jgi:hypothetical protein
MGLYNDSVNEGRTSWNYKYLGSELLEAATRLYREYLSKETEAREKMAEYMRDMTISNNDRKVEDAKRDIATFGKLKEQCEVFKYEFARKPNVEYELGLGDVTFFGLAEDGIPN